MPHGKGSQQPTRRSPREESGKEDDLELELDHTAREDTLSPLYSASNAGSAGAGSSVSSSQLEMMLAATSKMMADSMASSQRSMEASQKAMETSFLSALSTISTSTAVPPSIASAPPAVTPSSAVKVPKWTDGDQPFPFFTKLETAFTHNKVDKATWGHLLPVYLSGRAELAFSQVDSSLLGDYEAVKSVLLKALGDTPAHAERHWWSLARLSGETPADFFSRVRHTGLRRLSQLPTREAVVDHVILSRFLSLLPTDSYAAVMAQHPKTGLEAAEFLLDFEETRAYSRKRQPWQDHHHRREPHRSKSPNNSSEGTYSSGTGGGDTSSGSGVIEVTGGNPSAGAPASGSSSSSSRHSGGNSDRGYRKPIICHNCGEPGHIRPQCPHKVRTVRSPDSVSSAQSEAMFVPGWIAGCSSDKLKWDTGAERTLVRADYVPTAAYTGDVMKLATWRVNDDVSNHKLAKLTIKVGEVEVLATVAVVEQLPCPALLGSDLGASITRQIMAEVSAKLDEVVSDVEVPMQVVSDVEVPMQVDISVSDVVPMQSDELEDACDAPIEPEVACEAPPVVLEDIFGFDDSLFDPEDACDASAVVVHEIFDRPVYSLEPDKVTDALVHPISISEEWSQVVNVNVDEVVDGVKFEVPMQIEPEVVYEAPSIVLEDIFGFEDDLFEPEVVCEAPSVVVDDIFELQDSLLESEDACVAPTVLLDDIFSLSTYPFGPDLGEAEFFLPELEVLEASVAPVVAPARVDTFVVLKQLTDGGEEAFEVLEASIAPGFSDNLVVPMQQVVMKEVLAVDWISPADTVYDNCSTPEEFFVEDQADVVASGPVDGKTMVGLANCEFPDCVSETDPMLVPVPVARPESVVKLVILAMEDGTAPKLCGQSSTVLVDHCLHCAGCISKAPGKFVPGSCAFISIFDVFTLVISSIFSFCACISICLSKFLVVLFFGAWGPRTVFCKPWGKLEHVAMSVVLRKSPAVMDLVLHQDSMRVVVGYLTETTRRSTPENVERDVIYCSDCCLILPVVCVKFVLQTDHRALMFLSDAWHINSLNSDADTLSRRFPEESTQQDARRSCCQKRAFLLVLTPCLRQQREGGDVMESPLTVAAAHNI